MSAVHGTAIVGGGPAGLAPLVSASRDGRLSAVLSTGIAVVERGRAIGPGRIGRYGIMSDSTAETFMAAVARHADPCLETLTRHPFCVDMASRGRAAVPLRDAGTLQGLLGSVLERSISGAGGAVVTGHVAMSATRVRGLGWRTRIRRLVDGSEATIDSRRILVATGGRQDPSRTMASKLAGVSIGPACGSRLIHSEAALREGGVGRIASRLSAIEHPRIAILGGSTSALATAVSLLRGFPVGRLGVGAIRILHRRPLRVFYPSVDTALADGYREFGDDDVCPVSGFVYRLGGFRLDSRELVMSLLGVGGRPREPRVDAFMVGDGDHDLVGASLEHADLVIAALGYEPRLLPLSDERGCAIPLNGTHGRPAVDSLCRILDADGEPVPDAYGLGLAAGYRPSGALGGERSFVGQANGLWLWQTAVGGLVVDAMLRPSSMEAEHRMRIGDEALEYA